MFSRFACLALVLVLLNVCWSGSSLAQDDSPSCLDDDGNPVDWFIAYKFPSMRDQPQPFKSGLSYAYITSKPAADDNEDSVVDIEEIPSSGEPAKVQPTNHRANDQQDEEDSSIFLRLRTFLNKHLGFPSSPSSGNKRNRHNSNRGRKAYRESLEAEASSSKWIVSKKLITDPSSLVLRSLAPAYKSSKRQESLNWILYNDQPPEGDNLRGPSSKKAHAKGVVIMDTSSRDGVWLTHSVPQFPPPLGEHRLHFDENVSKYGQTFMCINFDVKLAGLQIARHLSSMNALVYDTKVSERLFDIVPGLHEFKNGLDGSSKRGRLKSGQDKLKQDIRTRAGLQLSIYSMSPEFEVDLYSGWLEQELDSSLYVETWQNGNGHPLNSSCSDPNYKVNNVKELRLYDDNLRTIFSWQHQKDHSKWAISETESRGLVCIADMNRMESQFERGGGAVCMKCPNCWSAFSKTILDVEPCHGWRRQRNNQHTELAR